MAPTVKLVMLTGIMFNDFPKNESINMLTVMVLAVTIIYQLSEHFCTTTVLHVNDTRITSTNLI